MANTKSLIDKSRPELGFADERLKSLKTESRVSDPARTRPRAPERQAIANQIASLSKSIDNDLLALVGLIKRGRKDRATIVCDLVARKRNRMLELINQRNLILAQKAEEDTPKTTPAKTKLVYNRKVYKRWSDNPVR